MRLRMDETDVVYYIISHTSYFDKMSTATIHRAQTTVNHKPSKLASFALCTIVLGSGTGVVGTAGFVSKLNTFMHNPAIQAFQNDSSYQQGNINKDFQDMGRGIVVSNIKYKSEILGRALSESKNEINEMGIGLALGTIGLISGCAYLLRKEIAAKNPER